MATNANVFNSRVTSEALEAKFRQVFPAQAGAELIQDLYASGVIQPVIDFSSVAEGSVLAENLQTAWDFSTGHQTVSAATVTLVNNPGFWKVDVNVLATFDTTASNSLLAITDGLSTKVIWEINSGTYGAFEGASINTETVIVVFLRSGDSLIATSSGTNSLLDANYRQIADVYGNLVNPLGFTFS